MSHPLDKLNLALQLANDHQRFIGPGLTVVSGTVDPLPPSIVYLEVISSLSSALSLERIDVFSFYDQLRGRLNTYVQTHPTIDQNLRTMGDLLISLLFLKSFPKNNPVALMPKEELYLTEDLSLSRDGLRKISYEKYISLVFNHLGRYLQSPIQQDGPVLQKKFLSQFIDIVEAFTTAAPLWDQDRCRAELIYKDLLYLVIARSKLERGIAQVNKGIVWSGESSFVEQTLEQSTNGHVRALSDDVIQMITDQRDRLFVEAKLLRHLLRLIDVTLKLAKIMSTYASDDALKVKRTESNRDSYDELDPIAIYERDNADLLVMGLELAVNRAGKKIVRTGDGSVIRPLLQRLIAYKRDNESASEARTGACYERFIATLELNELHRKQKQYIHKWNKILFCSEALVEDVDVVFEKYGHLQKRRHELLLEVGRLLHKEIENSLTSKVKTRFQAQGEVAVLCSDVLATVRSSLFEQNEVLLYAKISNTLDALFKRRTAKKSDFEKHKQIWFQTRDHDEADSQFEAYGWKKVGLDTFKQLRDENKNLWLGQISGVRKILADLEQSSDLRGNRVSIA